MTAILAIEQGGEHLVPRLVLLLCGSWGLLGAMSPRVSFLSLGAVCVLAGAASAQTAPVPSRPAPPLTVPIHPAPLDEQTQAALDANKPRTYAIRIKNVSPSLMAYWLDPKNHAAPPSALPGEREAIAILKDYSLPVGVERIVAVDPQNALLIFGTPKGAQELMQTIDLLDQPRLFKVVIDLRKVAFDSTIYWIDSLAPSAKEWQSAAPTLRVTREGETEALRALVGEDRAALQSLPVLETDLNVAARLPFATLAPGTPSYGPFIPNFGRAKNFEYTMPVLPAFPNLDPDIQPRKLRELPRPKRGEVNLIPIIGADEVLNLFTFGPGLKSEVVRVPDGETVVLSGSAKAMGLVPPSPRFDSFVLCVTPHVINSAPLPAAPEPAK